MKKFLTLVNVETLPILARLSDQEWHKIPKDSAKTVRWLRILVAAEYLSYYEGHYRLTATFYKDLETFNTLLGVPYEHTHPFVSINGNFSIDYYGNDA